MYETLLSISPRIFSRRLRTYKDIKTADSLSIIKFVGDAEQEAKNNADKIKNTRTGDIYGIAITREIVNRALIKNRINPFISDEAISEATNKYIKPPYD